MLFQMWLNVHKTVTRETKQTLFQKTTPIMPAEGDEWNSRPIIYTAFWNYKVKGQVRSQKKEEKSR